MPPQARHHQIRRQLPDWTATSKLAKEALSGFAFGCTELRATCPREGVMGHGPACSLVASSLSCSLLAKAFLRSAVGVKRANIFVKAALNSITSTPRSWSPGAQEPLEDLGSGLGSREVLLPTPSATSPWARRARSSPQHASRTRNPGSTLAESLRQDKRNLPKLQQDISWSHSERKGNEGQKKKKKQSHLALAVIRLGSFPPCP